MGTARIAAIIALPLISAAAAVVAIGPQFEAFVAWKVAPARVRLAEYDSRQQELAPAILSAVRELPLGSIQVRMEAASVESEFHISIRAAQPRTIRAAMISLDSQIRRRLEDRAGTEQDRVAGLTEPLIAEQAGLEAELANLQRVLAHENGEVRPWESLAESCAGLDRDSEALDRVRAELAATVTQREALEHAPPPTAAVVDPVIRKETYRQNVVLQQDRRHLQVQLAEIRSALLNLWQTASRNLDDTLDAAQQLEGLGETPEAVSLPAKTRTQTEQIAEAASDFHLQTAAFAQSWTRIFLGLQAAEIDPDSPKILETFDALTRLIGDFRHHSARQLTTLRARVRAFTEDTGDEARRHVLTSMTTRRLFALEGAVRRFEADIAGIDSGENYLLDAALESARALLHRTEGVRTALDNELDQQARSQALEQRRQKIATLTESVANLRSRLDDRIDGVLARGAEVQRSARQIPEAVQASADRLLARRQSDWYAARLAALERELAMLDDPARRPLAPSEVKMYAGTVDRMPANLTTLLIVGISAWAAVFFAVAGFWPVGRNEPAKAAPGPDASTGKPASIGHDGSGAPAQSHSNRINSAASSGSTR